MRKVRMYWNLHKKIWSVQDCKTGRVTDHVTALTLADAKFVVRPAGRAKVLRCLLYTSPSPRDGLLSRMPSSA